MASLNMPQYHRQHGPPGANPSATSSSRQTAPNRAPSPATKKFKMSDRLLHTQIKDIVPESQAYNDLLNFETISITQSEENV